MRVSPSSAPPLVLFPSSPLSLVSDTSGEFILNHTVVIQAAFGCLFSVSPTVAFSSKWWFLCLDADVFSWNMSSCVCVCVFLCVSPLSNISVTGKLQLDLSICASWVWLLSGYGNISRNWSRGNHFVKC